ncbi:MAG: hypothetical protein KF865_03250 [Bdellovibrionaceae bacterium]|nr:hypothetical protein [Pseudobdellovibrionaceae bacterium]
MFSNTAYEALYQLLGLSLHAKFIELITGETFFKGLILMIFGAMFFFTVLKFISRYLPGSLIERKNVPLSRFVKIVACLFLGLAILRVGQDAEVKDFQGKNWADNPYVQSHADSVESQYRVSVVFNIMSRTAEELTGLLSRVIDGIFAKGTSQLTAPNMFYKAIMYAGVSTIEDAGLRDQLRFYSNECFTKIIPSLGEFKNRGAVDGFFRASHEIDQELSSISIDLGDGKTTDCLAVKESTVQKLNDYASVQTKGLSDRLPPSAGIVYAYGGKLDPAYFKHYVASQALANFYADQTEGRLGIQKGAEVPGQTGYGFQILGRVFSWDGILGAIGLRDLQGASEAAHRSQEFSEHLSRAPHVAGFVRMLLIAVFPWLMFAVVAGKWRFLVVWFWIYFSVLLWTPLWTLLYHIMLGISMSSETMAAFGQMADGVSMYSASVVSHRIYYMFSIYSWLQLLIATLTTGSAFMFLKPLLGESQEEPAPDFLGTAQSLAGTGIEAGTAKGMTGVAKAVL